MDDLISRHAAIDALMEILDRPNHAEFLYTDEICKTLNNLPSAQPEPSTEIQEILDYLDNTLHPIISPDNWNVYSKLHDMVSNLPSAEVTLCHLDSPCEYQNADIAMPTAEKVGEWIEVENKWGGLEIRCSECGAKAPRDEWGNAMQSTYCPHCGARMEGSDNE